MGQSIPKSRKGNKRLADKQKGRAKSKRSGPKWLDNSQSWYDNERTVPTVKAEDMVKVEPEPEYDDDCGIELPKLTHHMILLFWGLLHF